MIDYDSDSEELINMEASDSYKLFSCAQKLSAIATTIPCHGKNIKGNMLIKIAHKCVKEWASDAIDLACEYEKDLDGAMIPAPTVDNKRVLHLQEPREWFMTLGGWKGMMPSKEFKSYFFFASDNSVTRESFTGVEVFNDGVIFPIIDGRVHIPNGFCIGNYDVTQYWKKSQTNKWERPTGKTDLSYKQILEVIKNIKNITNLRDNEIAFLQLHLLSSPKYIEKLNDKLAHQSREICKQITIFLNYLNALMFGIEASGLNAALLVSAMTLDLIVQGTLSYEDAFKANKEKNGVCKDGGMYPYACFGNNQGTYSQRENMMLRKPPSMKDWRNNLSLSPVGLKEVMLIKEWLKSAKVLDSKLDHETQLSKIRSAIKDLCTFYFSPWVNHIYTVDRFNVHSDVSIRP
jgi:hypothetical protein